MSSMRKMFELLNRINGLKIPISNKFTSDSGMNTKVKMSETIIVNLNGKNIG